MSQKNSKPLGKESEPKVPTDLSEALLVAPKAKEKWNALTPIARRDFTSWITSAKQQETRARRVDRTCDMLIKGKKRSCCYSIVPMDLYRIIGNDSKAKAHWKTLASHEKRDFIDWLVADNGSEARKEKIERVRAMLVAGKCKP